MTLCLASFGGNLRSVDGHISNPCEPRDCPPGTLPNQCSDETAPFLSDGVEYLVLPRQPCDPDNTLVIPGAISQKGIKCIASLEGFCPRCYQD